MIRPIKILIVTHSPFLCTGTAETTRLVFNTLLDRYPGHYELYQVGLLHFEKRFDARWPVYLTRSEIHAKRGWMLSQSDLDGRETVPLVVQHVDPDIVWVFNDPHNVAHLCGPGPQRRFKLVLYINIDGFASPPDFHFVFNADRIVTMSRFSKIALLAGHSNPEAVKIDTIYAPGDIDRFVPVSKSEKMELRRELFPSWMPENAFVLGWVGMNQWRKQVWIMYQVIHLLRSGRYLLCESCQRTLLPPLPEPLDFPVSGAPRATSSVEIRNEKCPYCGSEEVHMATPMEDVFLWVHMPRNQFADCWNIDVLHKLYDVVPGRDIHYTEGTAAFPHLAPEFLPKLYQMWDALLYLSGGEGFGVPTMEAMSTGIPVVYSNYSSHAELLTQADGGLPVGGLLQPEPSTCALRLIANVSEVLKAVRLLYHDPDLRQGLGQKGRRFADRHNCDIIADQWHMLFQRIDE